MVAANPLFAGGWSVKKFNATVINDIWPEVFFFSGVAAMVACVSKFTEHKLIIPSGLLTVLGTVLGLVISFRTSSAYERYQEGRKMWTNINIASRNIAQMIWIHVPIERNGDKMKRQTPLQSIIEKKSMVNLVQAFSVGLKHFLRGEPGIYYEDLFPLICILPRYASDQPGAHTEHDMLPLWHASEEEEHPCTHPGHIIRNGGTEPERTASEPTKSNTLTSDMSEKQQDGWFSSLTKKTPAQKRKTFDPEKALPCVEPHRPLKPARSPPETTLSDYLPFLRFFKWLFGLFSKRVRLRNQKSNRNAFGKKRKTALIDSNVPLEVCLYISNYSAYLMRCGLLQPAIATGITNNITMLQDTYSNLERIRSTPLPFAYQAHLRMSLWMYLFFLPFQIYKDFLWITIPGTAFASFLLLGFLEIGQEIENPFNYDANDLDLDSFCLQIQRELHEITAHTSPDPDVYLFSPWNQPFAPADRRTASELTKDGAEQYVPQDHDHDDYVDHGIPSLNRTLLRGWREVDDMTRHHHH